MNDSNYHLWRGAGLLCLLLFCGAKDAAAGAAPVVSNVRAAQRSGTSYVDITYDLADADSSSLTVTVGVSTNAGTTWFYPGASLTGAVGSGIAPGAGKQSAWNAGSDLPAKLFANVRIQVTADDATAPLPGGMALIPAGSFTMGNCMDPNEGWSEELPLHSVYVSGFYMDKYDVTKALWDEVYQWATNRPAGVRYSFEYGAQGKAANHPAHSMTWYDAVKWCNARSEKEGRVPAYYTDAGQASVYRSGQANVENGWVKWSSGYRLPTDAEWEKAARGGVSGQRFPWGNTISWGQANYYASPGYGGYDVNPTGGYDTNFISGGYPYTSPVGTFAANGYGLYDMSGNVWQWCWDWWGSYSSNSQSDPRGPVLPTSGSFRVGRGGGWNNFAGYCRAARRDVDYPDGRYGNLGFRSALPTGQ